MLVMAVIVAMVVMISMPRAIGFLTTVTHSFLKSLKVLIKSIDIQIARRVVKLEKYGHKHLKLIRV